MLSRRSVVSGHKPSTRGTNTSLAACMAMTLRRRLLETVVDSSQSRRAAPDGDSIARVAGVSSSRGVEYVAREACASGVRVARALSGFRSPSVRRAMLSWVEAAEQSREFHAALGHAVKSLRATGLRRALNTWSSISMRLMGLRRLLGSMKQRGAPCGIQRVGGQRGGFDGEARADVALAALPAQHSLCALG